MPRRDLNILRGMIDKSYVPEGREYLYVGESNRFMQEAKTARATLAGDRFFPVGIVLVKDGRIIARAGNGFSQGEKGWHICPRRVLECPSGTGYELCHYESSESHAEVMAVKTAEENGEETRGADAFLYGHYWCCQPCWQAMIKAGIKNVFLVDRASELFDHTKIFGRTIKNNMKKVYLSCALTNLPDEVCQSRREFYEKLAKACEEIGNPTYIPHPFFYPKKHF